jgi:hypothetical protein
MGCQTHGTALSCPFAVIVIQHSTKPLTPRYSSSLVSLRFHRHDQPVPKTLMVMRLGFRKGSILGYRPAPLSGGPEIFKLRSAHAAGDCAGAGSLGRPQPMRFVAQSRKPTFAVPRGTSSFKRGRATSTLPSRRPQVLVAEVVRATTAVGAMRCSPGEADISNIGFTEQFTSGRR